MANTAADFLKSVERVQEQIRLERELSERINAIAPQLGDEGQRLVELVERLRSLKSA